MFYSHSGLRAALAVCISAVLLCNPAFACSWAVFTAPAPDTPGWSPGKTDIAMVGRTMDWYYSDNAIIKGVKAGAELYAAEAEHNPLKYTAKFASIQIISFAPDVVSDALNEKGLQGSLLYLEGSKLPDYKENAPGVDPLRFIGYAVSMFASVDEVIRFVEEGAFNFIHVANPVAEDGQPSQYLPMHFAFSDAAGGRAIVEFLDGEAMIYSDWSDNAMTNEPPYAVHKALDAARYHPNGSISTIDRRARARLYLEDMYRSGKVVDSATAIMAMRGLLASVFAGTEEIDRSEPGDDPAQVKEFVYPTQWWTVIDLKAGRYYLTRIESWRAELYDFAMVEAMEGEQGILRPVD